MSFEMKANTVNQIPKGTEIFLENEPATYVCAVIRGRVLARSESVKLVLPTGSFLGVFDLSVGHYVSDYIATEDSMLYAFPIHDRKMLRTMLTTNNKDYRGLMVNSMTKYFYELSKINEDYHKMAAELYWLLTDSYAKYKSFCRDAGEGVHMLSALDNMTVYVDESPIDRSEFAYYEDLAKVPADVQKNFFGCGVELTMTHIKKLSSLFGFERTYLYRLFKKKVGVSIKDYVIKTRMNKAKLFLEKGYNVNSTATLVGYNDSFNFSKAFKKHYGISPNNITKNLAK